MLPPRPGSGLPACRNMQGKRLECPLCGTDCMPAQSTNCPDFLPPRLYIHMPPVRFSAWTGDNPPNAAPRSWSPFVRPETRSFCVPDDKDTGRPHMPPAHCPLPHSCSPDRGCCPDTRRECRPNVQRSAPETGERPLRSPCRPPAERTSAPRLPAHTPDHGGCWSA